MDNGGNGRANKAVKSPYDWLVCLNEISKSSKKKKKSKSKNADDDFWMDLGAADGGVCCGVGRDEINDQVEKIALMVADYIQPIL